MESLGFELTESSLPSIINSHVTYGFIHQTLYMKSVANKLCLKKTVFTYTLHGGGQIKSDFFNF